VLTASAICCMRKIALTLCQGSTALRGDFAHPTRSGSRRTDNDSTACPLYPPTQPRTYAALSIQPVASALAHTGQPLLLAISAAAALSYGTCRIAVDQPARVRSRMA